ncbi:HEAT repeat domain-containing protein [Cylindrospermum sp. FACHB-282]|uniref:HEAT repeat domain-containing protein n=1 Tax=Cylindrospermum sp. FACHB-282 TaxID=2692794 RepID=UPI0016895E78|nr:HEAT repeat domain-containing protein [Cylindrospermum sp. FACHB-282]MBD2386228.1 HEAT repeat domain-containing protein [Cylindrospermum sp. FACHB-282]
MVKNLNQFLEQAQAAYNAANLSLAIQYLQQLILEKDSQHPDILKNREDLLKLTLSIFEMGDFQQRWDIANVLGWLGNIAIPSLIDILEDEDAEEELRWYAVRKLGESHHPDAIAPLVQLIKTNQNDELKLMAAVALGQMGKIAILRVSQLLEHEDTRLLAVQALSHNRRTETITPLLSVVQDPQAEIRAAAIEALSSFHDNRVPPALLTAVDDVAAIVRRVAVSGLGFRPDLLKTLDLVKRLQPRLYDSDLQVRSTAVLSIARMGGDQAAKELFLLLTSPHTPISLQLEIIRALSWLGTTNSLEYLQQVLNQTLSETLWQEIVTVLGRVQQPQLKIRAAEILLDILQAFHPATKNASFKSAIALSLGQLGKMQAIEPLILLLADSDSQVRLHTIAALKNLAPEIAHQRLQQLANSPIQPDLQQGIAIALAEW